MQSEGRRTAVVIEDDDDIRHLVETVLTQAGFDVTACPNGYEGLEAVRSVDPTVVTLDVNMPGIDGFETAKRIRAISPAYIVMLTALGEEIDTLQGLESGADDYVTKPFRPRELRARIEAMLRRPRIGGPAAEPSVATAPPVMSAPSAADIAVPTASVPGTGSAEQLHHLGLAVDLATRVCTADGAEIALTRSEFDLLAALMQSGRRVRTKGDLAILLRNEHYVVSSFVSDADKRGIEVHMGNLRRKIGENSMTPRWIETVRGVGYRMTGSGDSA